MREIMLEMEQKYGKDELMATMNDDFSWGMLSGKLSALRWVLGEDWDFLDTYDELAEIRSTVRPSFQFRS
jgi:hypothetical protein